MLNVKKDPVPRDIQERAFDFACEIVRLQKELTRIGMVDRALIHQLLRSGTSVGANLEEATGGQSKADFISKCSIALKEARETRYWLRLIAATEKSLIGQLRPILSEAEELVAILTTIIKNAMTNKSRGIPL